GPVQIGLDHQADMFFAHLFQQGFEDVDGGLYPRGILHVDPDEVVAFLGLQGDALHVFQAEGFIDVEAQLGQFDGNIGVYAAFRDGVEDVDGGLGGLQGFLPGGYALTQVIQGDQKPISVEGLDGFDRLSQRLPRDKPGGPQAHAVPVDKPGYPPVAGEG